MTVNEKLCKNIASKLQATYVLEESPQWGNSNKYPKHMFYEEIIIKQGLYYISFCPLRILLQQQIHFNGNIFGNKCFKFVLTRVHYMVWITRVHYMVWKHTMYGCMYGSSQIRFISPPKSIDMFLISPQKHTLWVLISSTLMRHFYWVPTM